MANGEAEGDKEQCRWAVVTGANRGLGLEVAKSLAKDGWCLVLAGRDEDAMKECAAWICDTYKTQQVVRKGLDLADPDSIAGFCHALKHEHLSVQLLINNAGVCREEWTEEAFQESMRVNFGGPIALIHGLKEELVEGAIIVNVSSGDGRLANLPEDYRKWITGAKSVPDLEAVVRFRPPLPVGGGEKGAASAAPSRPASPYAISKAMLNAATRLLSADAEWRRKGVKFAAVDPGWARTDMGGPEAPRSAEQGAASILHAVRDPWLAGTFSRDGATIEW